MECHFVERLLRWHYSDASPGRDAFWWRGVEDPYAIFVAEILLARTQAARVAEVALGIVRRWLDFCSLATANEADLERALRPLGLQRVRALALKMAAIEVCTRWSGKLVV